MSPLSCFFQYNVISNQMGVCNLESLKRLLSESDSFFSSEKCCPSSFRLPTIAHTHVKTFCGAVGWRMYDKSKILEDEEMKKRNVSYSETAFSYGASITPPV